MKDNSEKIEGTTGAAARRSGRTGVRRKEIDPGYYVIYQNNVQVGRVFVGALEDEEHWELFASTTVKYKYPSSTESANQSKDVTMRFVYKGDEPGAPRDADEFTTGMAETSDYIRLLVD